MRVFQCETVVGEENDVRSNESRNVCSAFADVAGEKERTELVMAYPFEVDAKAVAQPTFLRMWVAGGFLDGLDVRFVNGGNAVIGEHGVGKTTLLVLARHVGDHPVPPACLAVHRKVLEKNLGTGRVYFTFQTPADGAHLALAPGRARTGAHG